MEHFLTREYPKGLPAVLWIVANMPTRNKIDRGLSSAPCPLPRKGTEPWGSILVPYRRLRLVLGCFSTR